MSQKKVGAELPTCLPDWASQRNWCVCASLCMDEVLRTLWMPLFQSMLSGLESLFLLVESRCVVAATQA